MIALWSALLACDEPAEVPTVPTTDSSEPSTDGDTGTPAPPEPEFGTMTVTVEGRTYTLELVNPVGLTDKPASLELRAEHRYRVATLGAFVVDEQPLTEATYALGQWGGPFERAEIGLTVIGDGTEVSYRTPLGRTVPGSLVIERLDRKAGVVSLSWSGELEKVDELQEVIGTEVVQGILTDVPLRLK